MMILLLALTLIPRVERKADEQAGTLRMYRELLRNPRVWLFFAAYAV